MSRIVKCKANFSQCPRIPPSLAIYEHTLPFAAGSLTEFNFFNAKGVRRSGWPSKKTKLQSLCRIGKVPCVRRGPR